MNQERTQLSQDMIEACLKMNSCGLNQGTSGNISCRYEEGMLVTPSGVAYDKMQIEDIVFVSENGEAEQGKIPSSEWRFHLSVLQARPEMNAVVHNHALYSSALSVMNRGIPSIHYMVAVAGGNDIPCIPYATYGTQALSDHIVQGIKTRDAVLMQHHGMIATGPSLAKALWLAGEVENLAKMYVQLLQITENVPVLPAAEMDIVLERFKNYGLKEPNS